MRQTHLSSLSHTGLKRAGGDDRRRHSRFAAIVVMAAVAVSASLLSHFHSETQLRSRLGEASATMTPTGPLAYFPR